MLQKHSGLVAPALLAAYALFAASPAFAQAGLLDMTFGNKGVTVTRLVGTVNSIDGVFPYGLALQPNGEILVLVNATNTTSSGAVVVTEVLRYTSAGVLDTSFGSKGIAALPTAFSESESLALQLNGQIVVAGIGNGIYGVERLNANGSADLSFGSNGLASASLNGRGPAPQLVVLVQPNGDILLGGQLISVGRGQPYQTMLARFTSTGAPDTSFGSGGSVVVTADNGCSALGLLSTGEFQVVDVDAVAQFTAAGSLESTVTGGTLVASAGSEQPSTPSLYQPDGAYLVPQAVYTGEESRAHNAATQVLRFTATGSADPTFSNTPFHFVGPGGTNIEAIPTAAAVQANGDIVVVGAQYTLSRSGTTTVNGLARLTPNGSLDASFGSGGTVANSIPSGTEGLDGVVIQPADGKIVTVGVAGNGTSLTVSRYLGQ